MASQLLNQEEKDEIDDVFRSLDINCNGQISKEDLARCYKEYFDMKLSEKEIDKVFAQVNFSGSGYIEYSEFTIAIMMSKGMVDDIKIQAAFKLFDQDGKGYISSDDIKRMLNLDDQHDDYLKKKILRQVDAEETGKIVLAQFKKIIQSDKSLVNRRNKLTKNVSLKRTPRRAQKDKQQAKVDLKEAMGASILSSSFWDDSSVCSASFRRNLSNDGSTTSMSSMRRQVSNPSSIPPPTAPGMRTVSLSEFPLENLKEGLDEDNSKAGLDMFESDSSDSDTEYNASESEEYGASARRS